MSSEWWKGWVELTPFLSATYCTATAAIKLTTSFQITIDTISWTIIHTHIDLNLWYVFDGFFVKRKSILSYSNYWTSNTNLLMKKNNKIIFFCSISTERLCPNKYSNDLYQNMVYHHSQVSKHKQNFAFLLKTR